MTATERKRLLNLEGRHAHLLAAASLEPRTAEELLDVSSMRHAEMLEVEAGSACIFVKQLFDWGYLIRDGRPYRYTLTPAGEDVLNRVHDAREGK